MPDAPQAVMVEGAGALRWGPHYLAIRYLAIETALYWNRIITALAFQGTAKTAIRSRFVSVSWSRPEHKPLFRRDLRPSFHPCNALIGQAKRAKARWIAAVCSLVNYWKCPRFAA